MAQQDLSPIYDLAGQRFNVDPSLLRAQAQEESGERTIDPKTGRLITSSAGAQGFMQFMPKTAAKYGVDVNDPSSSIYGAAHYMSDLLNQTNGDVASALQIYNGSLRNPRQTYARDVLGYWKNLQGNTSPTPPAPAPAPPQAQARGSVSADDVLKAMGGGKNAPAAPPSDQQPSQVAVAASPAPTVSSDQVLQSIHQQAGRKIAAALPAEGGQTPIDPYTHQPMQFMTAPKPGDVATPSLGQPIDETRVPGAAFQAQINVATDPAQKARIAAANLFPNMPFDQAMSRVRAGSDGRLVAIDDKGNPFYVEPRRVFNKAPSLTGNIFETSSYNPQPLLSVSHNALTPGNVAKVAGADVPGAVQGTIEAVPSIIGGPVAGPAGTGLATLATDVARQTVANRFDPQAQQKGPADVSLPMVYDAAGNAVAAGAGNFGNFLLRGAPVAVPANKIATIVRAKPTLIPESKAAAGLELQNVGRAGGEPGAAFPGEPPGGPTPPATPALRSERVPAARQTNRLVAEAEKPQPNALGATAPAPPPSTALQRAMTPAPPAQVTVPKGPVVGEPTAPPPVQLPGLGGPQAGTAAPAARTVLPAPAVAARGPTVGAEVQLNPLGDAAEKTGPYAANTPEEIAAIPERPPPLLVPPRSEAAVNARADEIIRWFAANGNKTADTNPGLSAATLAQKTGNPGLAALERAIRSIPEANNIFDRVDQTQNAARTSLISKLIGTPEDIAGLEEARDQATQRAYSRAFHQGNTPVDASPAIAAINNILTSSRGKIAEIREPLLKLRQEFYQRDPATNAVTDQLETDPEMLYGVRRAINTAISARAGSELSVSRQAAGELRNNVLPTLDNLIEQGAPGYKAYMNEYANLSQPIDAMRWLQNRRLTDARGNVSLPQVNNTIQALERERAKPGAQRADALNDDQVNQLRVLRDDLRRSANSSRGKALGSDTVQNLASSKAFNALTGPATKLAGRVAGAVGGGVIGGPVGAVAGALGEHGAESVISSVGAESERKVRQAVIDRLLDRNGLGMRALQGEEAPGP